MAIWVIGDVHGCGMELLYLINRIKPTPQDKIVLVGDIFDRAHHPHIVWELIHKYNIKCVLGNHDLKTLQYLTGTREDVPKHYHYALNLLADNRACSTNELVSFLQKLPLLIQIDDKIISHGGVDIQNPAVPNLSYNVYGAKKEDNVTIQKKNENNRSYWWDEYKENLRVVYGHFSCENNVPRIRKNPHGYINSVS